MYDGCINELDVSLAVRLDLKVLIFDFVVDLI